MTINAMGDLAHHLMLRTRSASLGNEVATLTQELSSGKVADVTRHLKGDVSGLLAIDRDAQRAEIYQSATQQAGFQAAAMQTSLEKMQGSAEDLSASLLQVGAGLADISTKVLSDQASHALGSIISALNTEVAGKSLFGGNATDRNPLQSYETMMSALKTAVSGSQSASEVIDLVENWFDSENGFQQTMYSGGSDPRDPMRIAPEEEIRLSTKADDPVFRDLLEAVVLGALAGSADLALSETEQQSLLNASGQRLLKSTDDLTVLRAQTGRTEARIEEVSTRHAATLSSLEMARTTMLRADPYETAIELEQVQFQLQSLYTLTARNARFNLLSYLE
jgi:flagellar hook-associated protein 3 FlgL